MAVYVSCKTKEEVLHDFGQRHVTCSNRQVEVIAHQAVGMNRVSESIHPVRQKPKKFPPIFIINENRRPARCRVPSHGAETQPYAASASLPCSKLTSVYAITQA
jgi:hypothetical protein